MREKTFEASYISAFCMELYLIIQAGIPFDEGVALLRSEEKEEYHRAVLDHLYQQLVSGEPLAEAMRSAGGFPLYVVEMVEIGQKTGHLEDVFRALSRYYGRIDQLKKTIRSAILYPAVLLVMMLFVVLVLLIKVLPIFQEVFQQLGAELSPVAKSLMQVGHILGSYGLFFLLALGVLCLFGAVWLRKEEHGERCFAWLQKKTERWKIRCLIASSRLANALVMTLSSGMDIDDSLDMAMRLVPEKQVQEKIEQCKRAMLLDGKSFAEASLDSALFSPLYCRMMDVGFRAGNIDTVMEEVARRSSDEVDDKIEAMLNCVEPTLVIVMSVMVGLILLSVMLPLMSIMSAIG